MSAALALVPPSDRSAMLAFEPTDMASLVDLCKILHESKLMPKGITNWQAAVTIAIRGRELGLTIMQAFASMYIIDGKVVLSGDLMVALVKRSPECKYMRLAECSSTKCTYETLREGDPEPTTITWSIEDATRAGLTSKDTWKKYPRAMLRARCGAEISRAVYPDRAMGMYDPDEVEAPHASHVAMPPRHDEMTGEVVEPRAKPLPAEPPPSESTPEQRRMFDEFAEAFTQMSKVGTRGEFQKLCREVKAAGLPKSLNLELIERAKATDAILKARAQVAEQREAEAALQRDADSDGASRDEGGA